MAVALFAFVSGNSGNRKKGSPSDKQHAYTPTHTHTHILVGTGSKKFNPLRAVHEQQYDCLALSSGDLRGGCKVGLSTAQGRQRPQLHIATLALVEL